MNNIRANVIPSYLSIQPQTFPATASQAISKLPFMVKVLEKAVSKQVIDVLEEWKTLFKHLRNHLS